MHKEKSRSNRNKRFWSKTLRSKEFNGKAELRNNRKKRIRRTRKGVEENIHLDSQRANSRKLENAKPRWHTWIQVYKNHVHP